MQENAVPGNEGLPCTGPQPDHCDQRRRQCFSLWASQCSPLAAPLGEYPGAVLSGYLAGRRTPPAGLAGKGRPILRDVLSPVPPGQVQPAPGAAGSNQITALHLKGKPYAYSPGTGVSPAVLSLLDEVFDSNFWSDGPMLRQFEQEFGAYVDCRPGRWPMAAPGCWRSWTIWRSGIRRWWCRPIPSGPPRRRRKKPGPGWFMPTATGKTSASAWRT